MRDATPARERTAEPQWMYSASETKILQAYLCRVIQVSDVMNAFDTAYRKVMSYTTIKERWENVEYSK